MSHSPLPWKECCRDCSAIEDADGVTIASFHTGGPDAEDIPMLENKAMLLACVNTHAELVAVLDELLHYAENACDEGYFDANEQSDGLQAAVKAAKELLAKVKQ